LYLPKRIFSGAALDCQASPVPVSLDKKERVASSDIEEGQIDVLAPPGVLVINASFI
jgi:hypothetical protein